MRELLILVGVCACFHSVGGTCNLPNANKECFRILFKGFQDSGSLDYFCRHNQGLSGTSQCIENAKSNCSRAYPSNFLKEYHNSDHTGTRIQKACEKVNGSEVLKQKDCIRQHVSFSTNCTSQSEQELYVNTLEAGPADTTDILHATCRFFGNITTCFSTHFGHCGKDVSDTINDLISTLQPTCAGFRHNVSFMTAFLTVLVTFSLQFH